jgi:hypothetical protein
MERVVRIGEFIPEEIDHWTFALKNPGEPLMIILEFFRPANKTVFYEIPVTLVDFTNQYVVVQNKRLNLLYKSSDKNLMSKLKRFKKIGHTTYIVGKPKKSGILKYLKCIP